MPRTLLTWLILACACVATAARSEPLPLVNDLEATVRAAREQHVPVFVAFTLKQCPYCATARRDYWAPMNGSDTWRGKMIMVELVLDGPPELRDFDGRVTTAREFAKRFGVRSVPTVILFDDHSAPVASPVIGLASGDFYGAYLDRAIESALLKMRNP